MSTESNKCFDPQVVPSRNYTDSNEKYAWWLLKRFEKDSGHLQCIESKQEFRMRRAFSGPNRTAFRMQYENSDEIGAFIKLTNSYCIIGSETQPEKIYSLIQGDFPEIPVIDTSLAGCGVIGRLCVGNKNGLIVPDLTYNTELNHIKEELPDSVKVAKVEERLSALGNVVVCNDKVALVHPDLDRETEEVIGDTLQVEVFRHVIANNPLVGSHCILNNLGGLVSVDMSNDDLENLSSLLELRLVPGTANQGNKLLGSVVVANDQIAYAGMKTTGREFTTIETALF